MVSAKKTTIVDLELNMIRLLLQRLVNSERGTYDYIYVSPNFVKSVNLSRAVLSNLFQIHFYEFVSCLGLAVTLISSTCIYEDNVLYRTLRIVVDNDVDK